MICPNCKKRWAPKTGQEFMFKDGDYVPRSEEIKKKWVMAFKNNQEELCDDCDEVLSCSTEDADYNY